VRCVACNCPFASADWRWVDTLEDYDAMCRKCRDIVYYTHIEDELDDRLESLPNPRDRGTTKVEP
jgi:hypothetical protein